MRNFAVVFLVAVAMTGAVANANNMELDDPVTPPMDIEGDSQKELDDPVTPPIDIESDGQKELDDPVTPPMDIESDGQKELDDPVTPPTDDDEPISEEADPDWMSWAGAYEGDMMLTEEQMRQLNGSSVERNAIRATSKHWPKGVIPYVISSSTFSSTDKSKIAQAFANYASKTNCVRFVKRTNQRDYISIIRGSGCYSYVGRSGGSQPVSLGYGCVYNSIIVHELMHAAGFFHEQSRCDRDTYVTIVSANVVSGKLHNFNKYSCSVITHLGEPYDYKSVMHYRATAFSKNGQKTIVRKDGSTAALGNTVGLSQIDINKLNKLYKSCSTTTVTSCVDRSRYCKMYAFVYSYCTRGRYTAVLAKYCPKACNKCGCQDQYSSCPSWANRYCKSSRYINFMTMFCKKSCNECGGSCVDNYSRCPYWAHIRKYCTTGRYTTFMNTYCKNSCRKSC